MGRCRWGGSSRASKGCLVPGSPFQDLCSFLIFRLKFCECHGIKHANNFIEHLKGTADSETPKTPSQPVWQNLPLTTGLFPQNLTALFSVHFILVLNCSATSGVPECGLVLLRALASEVFYLPIDLPQCDVHML